MSLVISGKSKKHLKRIEALARKLGLIVENTEETVEETTYESLGQLMNEKAMDGGIDSIKDPAEWQRQIREDKPLYGREE